MPLGNFASGPYTASHTPVGLSADAIGLTEDGWRSRVRILEEPIDKSDAYGASLIDSVYIGLCGNVVATFMEWDDKHMRLAFPWNAPLSLTATKLIVTQAAKPIGRLGSDVAGSLVLTAVANTPAATRGPATVTYGKIKSAPDGDIDWVMGPTHRKFAITFDLLLYLSTSDYILYSAT